MLSKEASLEVALCKQQKQKVAVLHGRKDWEKSSFLIFFYATFNRSLVSGLVMELIAGDRHKHTHYSYCTVYTRYTST